MSKVFIINTNKKASGTINELDMLHKEKCAAYYSPWKNKIDRIEPNDLVFLYSNGRGIIARGIATGVLEVADYKGQVDEEHYMHLNRFEQLNQFLESTDINNIIGSNVVLNRTMIELPYDDGLKVWHYITKNCF
ncbi:hypothetical protein V7152_17745 [Neobacillus drentensis]|uniref:hypothetical protein n=1 Tax=Neobacillus drentensis TaxID=220684 RepID=UPI002FFE4413